jgi:NhaP-type Na+/H+ or K+/H+ antiporter
MENLELMVGLLAAVAVAVRLAGRTAIPEPVLLVLAGLVVALIPGLPQVELDPALTLALFLPPLLYWPPSGCTSPGSWPCWPAGC